MKPFSSIFPFNCDWTILSTIFSNALHEQYLPIPFANLAAYGIDAIVEMHLSVFCRRGILTGFIR